MGREGGREGGGLRSLLTLRFWRTHSLLPPSIPPLAAADSARKITNGALSIGPRHRVADGRTKSRGTENVKRNNKCDPPTGPLSSPA